MFYQKLYFTTYCYYYILHRHWIIHFYHSPPLPHILHSLYLYITHANAEAILRQNVKTMNMKLTSVSSSSSSSCSSASPSRTCLAGNSFLPSIFSPSDFIFSMPFLSATTLVMKGKGGYKGLITANGVVVEMLVVSSGEVEELFCDYNAIKINYFPETMREITNFFLPID